MLPEPTTQNTAPARYGTAYRSIRLPIDAASIARNEKTPGRALVIQLSLLTASWNLFIFLGFIFFQNCVEVSPTRALASEQSHEKGELFNFEHRA